MLDITAMQIFERTEKNDLISKKEVLDILFLDPGIPEFQLKMIDALQVHKKDTDGKHLWDDNYNVRKEIII